jgi:large repetitive protein
MPKPGGLGGNLVTYTANVWNTPTTGEAMFGGGGASGKLNNVGVPVAPSGIGGSGGGFVLVRANAIGGSGTWDASGQNGANGLSPRSVADGAGGGGAGGFIDLRSKGTVACSEVLVRGGAGGSTLDLHGPGGGGSGGVAVVGPAGACAVTSTSGENGATTKSEARDAAPGAPGMTFSVPAL